MILKFTLLYRGGVSMNTVAAVLPEQITDVINIIKTISFVDVIDIACVSVASLLSL